MSEMLRQIRKLGAIKSLWLYLYMLKATLSALLIVPFFMTFNSVLSPSIFSRPVSHSWDLSVIVELLAERGDAIPALIMFIVVGAILYVILMQFINGGLYYTLVSGKHSPINWRDFFAECGVNFSTHMKITVLMAVVYLVLISAGMFLVSIIGVAGGKLIGKAALILMIFKLLVIMLILLAASIFSDSVRAASATFPEKTFKDVLKIGSEYFKPHLVRLLRIFLITYIPFLVIWIFVEWSALKVAGLPAGMIGIVLEFMLFQISSVARTGQKLWYLIILGRDFKSTNPGRFIPEQIEISFGR